MIYADYAATAPMLPQAREAMISAMEQCFGNPSSIHTAGRRAASLLEKSRAEIADVFNLYPSEVYFTSGGSEANNMALFGAAYGADNNKKHIIAGATEHPSVLEPINNLKAEGFETELLMPDGEGFIKPEIIENSIRGNSLLLCLMAANNESGTLQPIEEAGRICREKGVLLFCDAVQAAGHIALNMTKLQVDLMSISAHKFGGPKGVGALLCREGVKIKPLIYGGGQEMGKRSGTQNVQAVAGMAAAFKASVQSMEKEAERLKALRDYFEKGIEQFSCKVLGENSPRLPGISFVQFFGFDGEHLLLMLDLKDICVSAGAACSGGDKNGSVSAVAMGLSKKEAMETVRFSFGKNNAQEDIDEILKALNDIL